MIVDISATYMTTMFLLKNVHFSTSEAAKEETELRMSKVNEKHISSSISIEFIFSENAIIQSYCS